MYRREARRSQEGSGLFVLPTAAELKILGKSKLGRKFAPFCVLWVSSSEKSYKCLKSPKIGQKSKIHTGVRDRTRIKNSRRGCTSASARIKNSHAGMGVYVCAWVKIHTGARVCAWVSRRLRVLRDARDALRVFLHIRARKMGRRKKIKKFFGKVLHN